jgi:hypothetical protein
MKVPVTFESHPVRTLLLLFCGVCTKFWRGMFVLCFLDVVAGKFKSVRGKGERRGSTGTEMKSYALHCAMD